MVGTGAAYSRHLGNLRLGPHFAGSAVPLPTAGMGVVGRASKRVDHRSRHDPAYPEPATRSVDSRRLTSPAQHVMTKSRKRAGARWAATFIFAIGACARGLDHRPTPAAGASAGALPVTTAPPDRADQVASDGPCNTEPAPTAIPGNEDPPLPASDAADNPRVIAAPYRASVEAALARDCGATEREGAEGVPLDHRERPRRTQLGRVTHGPSGAEHILYMRVIDGKVVLRRADPMDPHGDPDLVVDLSTGRVAALPSPSPPTCAPTPVVGKAVIARACSSNEGDVWAESIGGRESVVLAKQLHGDIEILGVSCIDGVGLTVDRDRRFWSDRHAVWQRARRAPVPSLLYLGYQPDIVGRIGDDVYIAAHHRFSVVSLRPPGRETYLGFADQVAVGTGEAAWVDLTDHELPIVLGTRLGDDRIVALRSREPNSIAWHGRRLVVLDVDDAGWRIDLIDP